MSEATFHGTTTSKDTFDAKRWDKLVDQRAKKLKKQQQVAKELTEVLCGKDGLMNNSKRVIKNLDAAIVASRQPGYFKYYEPTDSVKKMETTGVVDKLQNRIRQLQIEMDRISEELKNMEEVRRSTKRNPANPGSLKNWFAKYGRPKHATPGKVTSFKPSTKIYGATRHHPAFKSVARTMSVGRKM